MFIGDPYGQRGNRVFYINEFPFQLSNEMNQPKMVVTVLVEDGRVIEIVKDKHDNSDGVPASDLSAPSQSHSPSSSSANQGRDSEYSNQPYDTIEV